MMYEDDETMDDFYAGMTDDEIIAFQFKVHESLMRNPEWIQPQKIMRDAEERL